MIVVDSNVIAYCWVNGPLTRLAQRVRVQDPDWHVPVLWRSEMRSILTGYLRDGSLTRPQIGRVMEAVESALAGREHLVPSSRGSRSPENRACPPTIANLSRWRRCFPSRS